MDNDEIIKERSDGRREQYFEFLQDFREFIAEYVRESVFELTIAELSVSKDKPVKVFDGFTPGKAIIRNQGEVACYLSTSGQGGYCLTPGDKIEFFVNHQVIATTISGSTVLGFVRT